MRRVFQGISIVLLIQSVVIFTCQAQENVDHWESLVNADNTWKYFPGTSEPPSDWTENSFDDGAWSEGTGGFGFGDEDDGTILEPMNSVYLRIHFTVIDINQIESLILLSDYDDAYIAYLNGQELSRAGISGDHPPFDQLADSEHEAGLYQGFYPSELIVDKTGVNQFLQNGDNVLTVQVHNITATSSDLSSNFYLIAGLNTSNILYQSTPVWFRPPVNFSESSLPIIKINTYGSNIPDEPKINAYIGIIDNGPGNINHVDDPFNDFEGPIGIEMRGSSSQYFFPKKQFAVELWTETGQDTSASLLGLPEEEDWILSAPYSDKTLIRNFLTYKLGADLGWYSPRTRLCEVYINDQYNGVYVLTEKIKRDKNRVDIANLNPDENTGDDVTGGYIVKIDKFDGAAQGLGWDSPYPPSNRSDIQVIHFQYHYPKETKITPQQQQYIRNSITSFETELRNDNFFDSDDGYRDKINLASFIDFAIMNELTRNVDGYRLSTFLYKDKDSKDGKIYIGPLWDFNLAFGNADYCDGSTIEGWAWDFNTICNGDYFLVPFWWKRFLQDPEYVYQFQSRWSTLRTGLFSNETIMDYIDSVALVLEEPQIRNFTKWPVLDEWVWPNNYVGGNYPNEIDYLKSWITARLSWMDINIANLEVITGIEDLSVSGKEITVFPNPTNGAFNIKFSELPASNSTLKIHDQLGQLILQRDLNLNDISENIISINESSRFNRGLYLINISDGSGRIYSGKIVVN